MTYASKLDLFDRYSSYTQQILNKNIESHKKFIEDLKESVDLEIWLFTQNGILLMKKVTHL
jgi:hypothetical protein